MDENAPPACPDSFFGAVSTAGYTLKTYVVNVYLKCFRDML
jgi:hypothetical protein